MAADLDLRCIAEGVETVAQRRMLKFLQCHLVQGFLYSQAVPADDFARAPDRAGDPGGRPRRRLAAGLGSGTFPCMRTRTVESRRDRMEMATEAGYPKVSLGSVLAGVLVAYGAFAIMAAIAGGILNAIGVDTRSLSTNDWREYGIATGAAAALSLFLSYLFGGYVAGRMARRAGALNGALVFLFGILLVAGLAAAVGTQADGDAVISNLRSMGVPTSGEEYAAIGTFAGLGAIVAMLARLDPRRHLGRALARQARWPGRSTRPSGPSATRRSSTTASGPPRSVGPVATSPPTQRHHDHARSTSATPAPPSTTTSCPSAPGRCTSARQQRPQGGGGVGSASEQPPPERRGLGPEAGAAERGELQVAHRVDGVAVDPHLEVEVRARRVAGRPAVPDHLLLWPPWPPRSPTRRLRWP